MNTLKDFLGRLGRGWVWVVAQFGGTLLLILAGLSWTRLPDKHGWQVALTLIIPVLLVISLFELEAGTMRRFARDDGRRVKLVHGAAALLGWLAVGWLAWWILDWCDDQISEWAGYLNSILSAHARSTVFTYAHISRWLSIAEWILRWIVVPGKILPYALASAQWGWRLPCRRALRILFNWQWWLGVVVAALLGVLLPSFSYAGEPAGTVSHQVWRVILKLAIAYLFAVGSWVLLLAWLAVAFDRQPEPAETDLDNDLLIRLRAGRVWIGAFFACALLGLLPDHLPSSPMVLTWLSVSLPVVLILAGIYVQTQFVRSLLSREGKPFRLIWGVLASLAWAIVALAAVSLINVCQNLYHPPAAVTALAWVVVPALFVPCLAASAQWALRLPWRRILLLLGDWRWWLGVLWAAIAGAALPALILNIATPDPNSGAAPESALDLWLKLIVMTVLQVGAWVLLLGWFAVLLGRQNRPPDEALVAVPVRSGPPEGEQTAKAELPPGDEGGQV